MADTRRACELTLIDARPTKKGAKRAAMKTLQNGTAAATQVATPGGPSARSQWQSHSRA